MWDERYSSEEYAFGTEPNDFLKMNYQQLPKGKILCLADGEGRNSVFLAEKGYEVTAVDSSAEGIKKAQLLAEQKGVEIEAIVADLADYELGIEKWDGIVSIFCHLPPALRQRVHAQIAPALKPNGVFLLESYRPEQLKYNTGGPKVAEMTISLNNLHDEISGLNCLMEQEIERDVTEGIYHTGLAAVTQFISKKQP